jgi:hypothetical protein
LAEVREQGEGQPEISRLKLELITFFKDNPGLIDCAEMIAARIGRDPAEVKKALDELAEKDICARMEHGDAPAVYAYAPSARFLQKIGEVAPELGQSSRMELLRLLFSREEQGDGPGG